MIPEAVNELVAALLGGVQRAIGDNLVGFYLRGSLALGDFIPDTSDVDVIAVTDRPIDDHDFAALARLHADLTTLPNPYANRMEMTYIDRAALRRYTPGLHHVTLGQGETLAWTEHRPNWLFERWIVREHGIPLLGPDPRTLIDPVDPMEIRAAVRIRLHDWVEWADQSDDPDWMLPRSHKAYAVETMCRALYTLAHGELTTKPRSVAWALGVLPEPWRSTVARSQQWRTDSTIDLSIAPEVAALIRWADAHGEAAVQATTDELPDPPIAS